MLGVKYYAVYEESELPNLVNFEYAYNMNHLKVYKNLNYIGFGYTCEDIKYTSELKKLEELNHTIFVDNGNLDIDEYIDLQEVPFNIYEKGNNFLKGNIELGSKNILQLPIPNNKGWKILINGIEKEPISVNGGFLGLQLESGYNEIELYFMSPGFKVGIITTIIGCCLLSCIIIKGWIKKYGKTKENL